MTELLTIVARQAMLLMKALCQCTPEELMPPTTGHGKICYLELPALDVGTSAAFYQAVFGWDVRTREDGSTAFDDGVGQVSGTWMTARKAWTQDPLTNGPMIHIMVDDAAATVELIRANGGEIVRGIGDYVQEETVAIFRDPAGNVLGIYQERG